MWQLNEPLHLRSAWLVHSRFAMSQDLPAGISAREKIILTKHFVQKLFNLICRSPENTLFGKVPEM